MAVIETGGGHRHGGLVPSGFGRVRALGFRSGFPPSLLTNVDGSSLADVDLLSQPSLYGRRHGAHR